MKFSIITVCLNSVATIERTIKSVLRQKDIELEYIIIDGGSNDGTTDIIHTYESQIDYWCSEPDDGLYDAMNKGIRRATGDIVGIINSDDWYNEDIFKKVEEYFKQNDADIVYGNIYTVNTEGIRSIMITKPLEALWFEMVIPHTSVFVKKYVYDELGCFDLKYKLAADHELMLRFYSNHKKFGFMQDYIANFSIGGLSMNRLIEITEEHKKIVEKYSDMSPDKEETMLKFQQWYKRRKFCIAIEYEKGILYDLLCEYFDESIQEIIIFGTGIWGNRFYSALKNEDIKIVSFVDNDSNKWNKLFFKIPVVSPMRLEQTEGYVLIASDNAGMGIKEQLENMGNKKLKTVLLDELANLYSLYVNMT